MSILKIINDKEEIKLNFEKITYLYGQNGEEKQKIINNIKTYFSREKIKEDILVLQDDEEIGRTYFCVKIFNNIEDILAQLENKKDTNLNEALLNHANDLATSEKLNILNVQIEEIISSVNEKLIKDKLEYKITHEDINVAQLIKNNLKIEKEELKVTTFDNIKFMLQLVVSNYKYSPTQQIIIFNNIDVYLNKPEFFLLIKELEDITEQYDIKFVLVTSKNGFVNINKNNINSFNTVNKTVFNIKEVYEVQNFINMNYPMHKVFDENDIIHILNEIAQFIYSDEVLSIQSQVALKIFNNSYGILQKEAKKCNKIEMNYLLNGEKMV